MKYLLIFLLFVITLTNCKGDDYYNLGIYQARQGNHEKAIEYFTEAIRQNPKDHQAYFNRAYSQQLLGGKEAMIIKDYSKCLQLVPNDYEVYINRGVVYMNIGKIDDAITDYKKSIEINEENPMAFSNLGNAYMLKKDVENACLNWKKSNDLGNQKVLNLIQANCQ